MLGLFVYLSSGAGVYAPAQLLGWLDRGRVRAASADPDAPDSGQRLYQTSRSAGVIRR